MPKPNAGQSSVGDPGGVTKQSCRRGACGSIQSASQSWSELGTEDREAEPCCVDAGLVQSGPRMAAVQGLATLLQVPAATAFNWPDSFHFCCSGFFMKKKVTKQFIIPDFVLHYLGSLEISF